MATLLDVRDLKTEFHTQDGVVHAVNGVSFSVEEGETLGLVGESGSGKSVSMLSVMRLIPIPPGKIPNGEVVFQGQDLLKLSDEEMRQVRGNKIAMVFQDPMTSLNPVLTIGTQITEALELHLGMTHEQARKRAADLLTMVNIPEAANRLDDYPHHAYHGRPAAFARAGKSDGAACTAGTAVVRATVSTEHVPQGPHDFSRPGSRVAPRGRFGGHCALHRYESSPSVTRPPWPGLRHHWRR